MSNTKMSNLDFYLPLLKGGLGGFNLKKLLPLSSPPTGKQVSKREGTMVITSL